MFLCGERFEECVKMVQANNYSQARMVKSADTADLKSADLNRSWGFKSPSGHHRTNSLRSRGRLAGEALSKGQRGRFMRSVCAAESCTAECGN
jgi:hypothetical protein